MGVHYIAESVASTMLSFVFLQFWTELSLDNLKSDGLIAENYIHLENASRVIELLSGSYATIGLLTNFVLNVFVLLVLCLKVHCGNGRAFLFGMWGFPWTWQHC